VHIELFDGLGSPRRFEQIVFDSKPPPDEQMTGIVWDIPRLNRFVVEKVAIENGEDPVVRS